MYGIFTYIINDLRYIYLLSVVHLPQKNPTIPVPCAFDSTFRWRSGAETFHHIAILIFWFGGPKGWCICQGSSAPESPKLFQHPMLKADMFPLISCRTWGKWSKSSLHELTPLSWNNVVQDMEISPNISLAPSKWRNPHLYINSMDTAHVRGETPHPPKIDENEAQDYSIFLGTWNFWWMWEFRSTWKTANWRTVSASGKKNSLKLGIRSLIHTG